MKYSYEFKKECVQLYKQGKWVDTPNGIKKGNFHSDEKLAMISKILAGNSIRSVAIENGINDG